MSSELSVLPWAFAGLGAVFCVLGLLGLRTTIVRRRHWVRVQGVVVASRLSNVGGEGGMVQVQLSYDFQGTAHTAWNPYTATSGLGPRDGQPVDVLVNPDRPGQAVLAGGASSGLWVSIAMVGLGALAMAVGAAILL